MLPIKDNWKILPQIIIIWSKKKSCKEKISFNEYNTKCAIKG